MKPLQQELFKFLRQTESKKRSFTIEEAAAASGHKESTLRTYYSKYFKNHWLPDGDNRFKPQGFLNMSDSDFEELMTQNK